MKRPLLTLAILSSALNLTPALATELSNLSIGQLESRISFKQSAIYFDGVFLAEIQDQSLRQQTVKALSRLVSVSKLVESNIKSDKSDELEDAILSLKEKMTALEEQQPEIANQVKSKVLGEMLKEGVVVIDDTETSRFERVQVTLNDSIVARLEERQGVVRSLAGEGVVCI